MCGMNASTKHETRTAVSANGLRKAYGEDTHRGFRERPA